MNKKLYIYIVTGILFCTISSCKSIQKESRRKNQELTFSNSIPEAEQRKVDYIFQEAIRLKTLEKHDAAFELLRYCMEIDSLNAPVMYELSNYYLMLRQTEASKKLLTKAIDLDPDNKWYKWGLASVYLEEGDAETTIPIIEEIAASTDDNLSLLEVLTDLYTQTGQYEKAIKTFNLIEEEIGTNEIISINKFQMYLLMKDQKKAFQEIDKLQASYPNELKYTVLKGDLLLSLNEREKALNIYENVNKKEPDNPNLLVSLANFDMAVGNPLENSLRKVIYSEDVSYEAKSGLLSKYAERLKTPEEETDKYLFTDSLFRYMIDKYPIETQIKGMYSGFLFKQKKEKEAVSYLENVADLDPNNKKTWELLINYYRQEENWEKLREISQKAVKALPEEGIFWFYLGAAYYQLEHYDEALEVYKTGIVQIENSSKNAMVLSELYGMMGDIYQRKKDEERAIQAYENALKYNEQNISVLNNYSYYLSQLKKDLSKAEWMSGKSIKMDDKNPTFLDTYAWIYFVQGNYTLAKFYIERAINLGVGDNPEVIEHYGDILYMSGEKEQAVEQWKKAKDQGGNSEFLDEKIRTQTYIE